MVESDIRVFVVGDEGGGAIDEDVVVLVTSTVGSATIFEGVTSTIGPSFGGVVEKSRVLARKTGGRVILKGLRELTGL